MNTSGLGSLLWFLALGSFFYFIMRMGGCGGGHDRRDEESSGHGRHGGERAGGKLKDPVCGTAVEVTTAKTSVYRGETYYFCSNGCREKFEASPDSYASPEKGGCC